MTPTSRTILVTGTRFAQGPVAATRGCRWLGLAEAFGFAYDRNPGKAGPATARGPNPAADTGNEAHGHRSEARQDGTRTIPDPGTRRRRDVARSRRDVASAHGEGGRPRRRGRHPPGPVHGPALPPGPACRAPARPERPDRVQLRRDRQGTRAPRHPLAGRPRTRLDRRPARALRGPWSSVRLVHRPYAGRGRLRRPRIPHGSGILRRLRRPEPRARRDSPRRGVRSLEERGGGAGEPMFHLCAIGSRGDMLEFQRAVLDRLDGRVQTFVQRSPRYLGTMCEVLRHDASKWSAVLHVAELWGVDPAEICAVGDDVNDVPMIRAPGSAWRWAMPRPRSWPPPTSSPATTTATAWPCS